MPSVFTGRAHAVRAWVAHAALVFGFAFTAALTCSVLAEKSLILGLYLRT